MPVDSLDPTSRDLAIRTIYGEAAREPDEGKAAVAAVIRNRVAAGRFGGDDVRGVVLAKNQFEPWNRADARSRMMSLKPGMPDYDRIGQIVDGVWSGQVADPTKGATHFFAPQAQAALGRSVPAWAQGEGQVIGRHTFFTPDERGRGIARTISASTSTTPAQTDAPPAFGALGGLAGGPPAALGDSTSSTNNSMAGLKAFEESLKPPEHAIPPLTMPALTDQAAIEAQRKMLMRFLGEEPATA